MALRPLRERKATAVIDRLQAGRTDYYVFPLQVHGDYQIRAYSPYADLRVAIDEIVQSFARNGPATARLVVKAHPLDSGLINWRKVVRAASTSAGIADRVDYIDGGALDRLLDGARGVVTVNSTVGLWALLAGRPVVTLGSAIYDVRGLTFDGELDRFWTEASPPDRELLEDFVRALAGTVQIRGVYHRRPGLNAAVASAVDRLAQGLVNSPLNPMPTYSVASQHAD